jgi:hypothetical protein
MLTGICQQFLVPGALKLSPSAGLDSVTILISTNDE